MNQKRLNRIKRHKRVRATVRGTAARPRLSVFRSSQHIHLQLIDDELGKTLASASSLGFSKMSGVEKAEAAAKKLAGQAHALGITTAVFDRGGFDYHGQVKKVAEIVREAGLKI